MFRFLLDLFWDVDETPDRIGAVGFAMMAAFSIFCLLVLLFH